MQKINDETIEAVTHTHTHTHTIVLNNKKVGAHCMRPNTKKWIFTDKIKGKVKQKSLALPFCIFINQKRRRKPMKKLKEKQIIENKRMSDVPTSNIQHLTSNVAITLIALIITIIILLILAGVTLNMVMGENGIIEKAQIAKERTNQSQENEKEEIGNLENDIDKYTNRGNIQSGDVLYNNSEGATTGTLTNSINNYDLIVVIYGSPLNGSSNSNTARSSGIITPEYSKLEINFSDGLGALYGYIEFSNNNYNINIMYDNSNWSTRYKVYKVVGIKF